MTKSISSGGTPAPRIAIGVDIGGTKIAAASVNEAGHVLDRVVVPTPTGGVDATVAALSRIVEELVNRRPAIVAIGAGAAGVVEWPSGYVRFAPNNAYRDLPLRDCLMQVSGLTVVAENDANVAAVGEARFGSGAGYSHSITLTLGTGIGGGVVIDGQLYRGPSGLAGEVGHLIVNPKDGPRCGCGAYGCLETMASGTALARAAVKSGGALATLSKCADKGAGAAVADSARRGNPAAVALFDELGYWLGIGIASLVNMIEPEVVIVGGGLGTAASDLLLSPTRKTFEQYVFARDHRHLPPIVSAKLGADAGVIGAAVVALDRHAQLIAGAG